MPITGEPVGDWLNDDMTLCTLRARCQIDAVRSTRSAYVLTLTTYAASIPEQETENPLPEPVAAVRKTNVVPLRHAQGG